ncbi:MAG TPA: SIR2 family protein [Pyrinomonadaceae bacterium]|nr:SIR2 family protein [Pyrinomonadaceae bacterium]
MSSSEENIITQSDAANAQKRLEERYQDDVDYIAGRVKAGECILFLGSAIHAEAPPGSNYQYPPDKRPVFGGDLSQLLARECRYPDADHENLQRVAWYYEWLRSRNRLVGEVRNAVQTGREPSPVLRGLARLGFPLVITTNYDQLYEQAIHQVAQESARAHGEFQDDVTGVTADIVKCIYSKKSTVFTKDCPAKPSSARPYLLKIHGDVDQSESIVITDEDYIQFVLRMSDKADFRPVGSTMLMHLEKWPTLFIGYRLKDYNLRLLFKSLRWKLDSANIPDTYAVDPQPDVLIRDVWESQNRYIRFIEKNLWDFVPDLYRAVTGQEMPQ